MNILEIEHAAFMSCPAEHETTKKGMVLRSNGGYTKRANSANVLVDCDNNEDQLVRIGESYFGDRGQKKIFRMLSTFNHGKMDLELENKGYELIETTNVLIQRLGKTEDKCLAIENVPISDWIGNFYLVSEDEDSHQNEHLQMLQYVQSKLFAAVLRDSQGEIVSMGLGTIEKGYFGIFNIVTAKAYQRLGYSHTLISDLLSWAKSLNAHTAYVQVRQANYPGLGLYEKLGYTDGYHYWYRVKVEG
jgi:GNAT superfamily N-acetyltransferase